MEEFNADNIFTLPLVIGSNCSDSANSHSVNGLQVELADASNIVSKTLLVYQDTTLLTSDNGEGQPVVRFLCELEDNHDENIDSCSNTAQTNGLVDGASETLSFTNSTCSLNFTNGDLGESSDTLSYGMSSHDAISSSDISDVVSVKSVDIDLFNGSLDSFIETVILFQCRLCQHASNDKSDIIRHLKSFHLINNTQKEGMVILKGKGDAVESVDIKREKIEDEKSAETQATVYMCGKCSLPFETMAECKSHMSNHPKAKGGSKVNGKAPKRDNQPNIVLLTRQTASEPKNEYVTLSNVKKEEPETVEEVTEGKDCPDLVREKNFKCSKETCELKFSTEELMTLHLECHWISPNTEEKAPYKCCRCHYTFKKWSELALHLWKSHHIDLDLFKCSVCTFKSVSRFELRRHFKNHAVGDWYCRVCGKSFVEEELYLAHSSFAHGLNPTAEGEKKKKKKVEECGECGMRLSSARALKKHVKVVHGKLRPYVCQVCPFTSSTLATLQLHLRQHTGETPFTCDDCPFKTRDHNTMRRHRMRHSFVKPYACKHCQFSGVQSTQLKNHILKFHPESTDVFGCPDCSFSTLSESLMISHRKVHHRDGRTNKISDEVNRDRNLSYMFPSSKNKANKEESSKMEVEDEESSSQCYFESEQHVPDTGGITIPAEETPKIEPHSTCGGENQLNDPGGGFQTGDILVPNEDTMPLS